MAGRLEGRGVRGPGGVPSHPKLRRQMGGVDAMRVPPGPMRPRRQGGARRVAERRADARMLAAAGAVERHLLDRPVPPEAPLVVEVRALDPRARLTGVVFPGEHRVVRRDPS